jgi:hypothetical protein
MREKGYLQTCELAEKLTAELGRTVTVSGLNSALSRGRIKGVLHKASNLWFFPADTKLPNSKKKNGENKQDEPVVLEPWVNWPAPGVVKIAVMGLKRNYQVSERRDLGWLCGVL